MSFATIRSSRLRSSLSAAFASRSWLSAAKPIRTSRSRARAAVAARMSVVLASWSVRSSSFFLIFCSATVGRAVVGDGRRHHQQVGVGQGVPCTASCISAALTTRRTSTPSGGGQRGRRGDQHHRCASVARRLGDGVAHLPGRVVGDVADRVDRLLGAASRHDDAPAGQVAVAGQHDPQRVHDHRRLGQPPLPDQPGGHPPVARLDDGGAALAQRLTFAWTAGWSYMSASMAGAITSGARVARHGRGDADRRPGRAPASPACAPSPARCRPRPRDAPG